MFPVRRRRQSLAEATANPSRRHGPQLFCAACRFCVMGGWCSIKARSVMAKTIMCEFGRRAKAVEYHQRYVARKKS